MNYLYLSPAFPPHNYLFCRALAARGAHVFGIGDSPDSDVRGELREALTEYVWVPSLADDDALLGAARALVARHGHLQGIDSNMEIWLGAEGRLRETLHVEGLRPAAIEAGRSKFAMAEVFRAAGLAHPATERVTTLAQARTFARANGFPLVFKPDTGAGAVRTFPVDDERALEAAFEGDLSGYVMQPFVGTDIITFDGLTDRDGKIVFSTAHRYDTGIMQVVSGHLDGHYYSLRSLPEGLAEAGARAVEAFDVRGRFFHLELFDTPAGFVALEMNLRPPGGFTTDMMNYACDIDVYDLWAGVVLGQPVSTAFERKYHVAHAGRRDGRDYRVPHDELLGALGDTLILHRRLPREFAAMQGDVMYLLRHPDLGALREAIALVQTRR